MDPNVIEVFIPIVSMVVLGVVLWAFFHFRYKTRVRVQETLQAALDRGTDLTPELIDRIAGPKPSNDRDLRRGLVSIAIGVAFAIFGFMVDDMEAVRPMIGIGLFPILVGLAYLVMWRMGKSESRP